MRFLLRLKHWQLFTIIWGIPTALHIYTFSDLDLMLKLFPVTMILVTIGTLGWVWAISTELGKTTLLYDGRCTMDLHTMPQKARRLDGTGQC